MWSYLLQRRVQQQHRPDVVDDVQAGLPLIKFHHSVALWLESAVMGSTW